MIEYLNLEDVALQRGENIFKVARLLTKNEMENVYINMYIVLFKK